MKTQLFRNDNWDKLQIELDNFLKEKLPTDIVDMSFTIGNQYYVLVTYKI